MMHFGVDTKSLDEDDPSQYSLKTTLQESEILIDNNSPMNQICHYMEDHLADISRSEKYNQDIVDALIIPGIDTNNQDKIAYVKMMIDDFYNVKKNLKSKNSNDLIITNNLSVESYSNINQYAKAIRVKAFEFFDDEYELTNYIIKVCYILKYHNSKSFAWTCFGAQILNSLILNSKTKTAIFPVLDPNGSMDYLYNTYRLDTIDLSSIDTDKPTPEYNVEFIQGEEEEDVTANIQ